LEIETEMEIRFQFATTLSKRKRTCAQCYT
jgi:hypothetical protein